MQTEFESIIAILDKQTKKRYTKKEEEENGSTVVEFEKHFNHNGENDDDEFKDYGNITIKIEFNKGPDAHTYGGSKKRIIKRKKTTRRNRKTKK